MTKYGMVSSRNYSERKWQTWVPVGTVKSRMHNALKALKEIFDE